MQALIVRFVTVSVFVLHGKAVTSMGKRKRVEKERIEAEGKEEQEALFPTITHPKKRAFLLAYMQTGVVTAAAKAAKIDRRTVYNWLDSDPDFAEAMEQAKEAVVDMLEHEAIKRATTGKSDTLLIFLLKGMKPEKYSDRLRAEIEHSGGINVEIAIPDEVDD